MKKTSDKISNKSKNTTSKTTVKKTRQNKNSTKKAGSEKIQRVAAKKVESKKANKVKKTIAKEIVQPVQSKKTIELNQSKKALIAKAKAKSYDYETSTDYIRENINIVMQVARHLYIIYEYKLFRSHYNTFEDYVKNEFDYTFGRAYQLIRAYHVAHYINSRISEEIITTEPQCRELLRLRASDADTKDGRQKKSNERRLKLVQEIMKSHKSVSTSLIVTKVSELIEHDLGGKSVEQYEAAVLSTFKGVKTRMQHMLNVTRMPSNDKAAIKKTAIKELEKLLKDIKQDKY